MATITISGMRQVTIIMNLSGLQMIQNKALINGGRGEMTAQLSSAQSKAL